MPHENLHQWQRGDKLDHKYWAQTNRAVERLDRSSHGGISYGNTAFSGSGHIDFAKIFFVRMSEVLGVQSSSGFQNREGGLVSLNLKTGDWEQYDGRVDIVTSAFYDLPYDEDDLVPCVIHQSKLVPLWNRTVRHVVTFGDADDYPSEGAVGECDNVVYPIKFVRISYLEVPGRQKPVIEYLDPTEEEDDVVLNLYGGADAYIPPWSIIWVYQVTGQWFTYVQGPVECSSASSSSSVNSSSSSSSSFSSSSSSESSSLNSSSSSSGGSSASSVSDGSSSVSQSVSGSETISGGEFTLM